MTHNDYTGHSSGVEGYDVLGQNAYSPYYAGPEPDDLASQNRPDAGFGSRTAKAACHDVKRYQGGTMPDYVMDEVYEKSPAQIAAEDATDSWLGTENFAGSSHETRQRRWRPEDNTGEDHDSDWPRVY